MAELSNLRVAVLASDGVEQAELLKPVEALRSAGAVVDILSPDGSPIQGFNHIDKADTIEATGALKGVDANQYDAMLLPGGAVNADFLRAAPETQQFISEIFEAGKPVAAICHAPWELISAGVASGRRMTSFHTIQDDLVNAGAEWVDEEVVVDGNLVTSRKPDDIPAFNREMLKLFSRVPAAATR
jgi:protease I